MSRLNLMSMRVLCFLKFSILLLVTISWFSSGNLPPLHPQPLCAPGLGSRRLRPNLIWTSQSWATVIGTELMARIFLSDWNSVEWVCLLSQERGWFRRAGILDPVAWVWIPVPQFYYLLARWLWVSHSSSLNLSIPYEIEPRILPILWGCSQDCKN